MLHSTKLSATFFFDHIGAKKKVRKKETQKKYFALCGARGGLRALHLRELLKKLDQNFHHISFANTFIKQK